MNVAGVSDLHLVLRRGTSVWSTPNLNGRLESLDPQPQMIRTIYVNAPLEPHYLANARGSLLNETAGLMAFVPCPDGPPFRSGLPFTFAGEFPVGNEMGRHYRRATKMFNPGDVEGAWMTGGPGATEASLWRLFRAELDALGRWVLTLEPIRFSSKFPNADFSSLKAPLLQKTVERYYRDMTRAAMADSYRAVVTEAKNIVEAIIADKLGTVETSRDLSENLQTVKKQLDINSEDGAWTYLEYHLAQKIRIVHGQTHATAPTRIGRSLRPEFALSVADDLIELLTSWQFCKASS